MFVGALTLVFGFALQRFGSGIPSSESQKMPYLGGGAPRAHAWQRYHVRYYSMTLLFIAFEMERSEEHTSELQSLMRISYAVFCLKKKNNNILIETPHNTCLYKPHHEIRQYTQIQSYTTD